MPIKSNDAGDYQSSSGGVFAQFSGNSFGKNATSGEKGAHIYNKKRSAKVEDTSAQLFELNGNERLVSFSELISRIRKSFITSTASKLKKDNR